MNIRPVPRSCCALISLLLMSGPAWGMAPPAASTASTPAAASAVTVDYQDPQQFTETRFAFQHRYNHDDYLGKLKSFLVRTATPMLASGQKLDITITDIQLAGRYEPWHGPQLDRVRFMRDIYPPRIDLDFRLIGADGDIIREGSRKLRNLGYLHDAPARPGDTDPLRYDKALIGKWLHRGPAKW